MQMAPSTEYQQKVRKPLQDSLFAALWPVLSVHNRAMALNEEMKKAFIDSLADRLTGEFLSKSFEFEKKQLKVEADKIAREATDARIKQIQTMRTISLDDFTKRVKLCLNALVKERNPEKRWIPDEFIRKSFELMLGYFHPQSPTRLDRNKGICLLGPIGTGKSTLMAAFKDNPLASFRVIKAQEIVDAYVKNPELAMSKILSYAPIHDEPNDYGFTQYEILIEEVGREQLSIIPKGAAYQSTPVNVMERIIMELYDRPSIRVHMISNAELTGDEVYEAKFEKLYGEAASSRIFDMFNVITQDSNAPNRRFL